MGSWNPAYIPLSAVPNATWPCRLRHLTWTLSRGSKEEHVASSSARSFLFKPFLSAPSCVQRQLQGSSCSHRTKPPSVFLPKYIPGEFIPMWLSANIVLLVQDLFSLSGVYPAVFIASSLFYTVKRAQRSLSPCLDLRVAFTSSSTLHLHLRLALCILNHATAQKAPAVTILPLQGRFPCLHNADSYIGRTLEFR